MSGHAQRLLFVGHHGGRTGAPLLLLHFLRWLAANTPLEFEVLLRSGGELVPEYSALAPTRVLEPEARDRVPYWRRARRRLGLDRALETRLARWYPLDDFPLVYSNTVANGELVEIFGRRGHRLIGHAHEMRYAIERWGGPAGRASSGRVQAWIAASDPVKRDLVAAWAVAESRIEVIHEFGQPLAFDPAAQQAARERIRQELGVTPSDIVVGLCGTMDWRKGADLLPPLAKAVLRSAGSPTYRFVWVGAAAPAPGQLELTHDLAALGVGGRITLTGQVSNPHDYMSAFDVFALTSREDPCPLVMLEAAALGLPIVCFRESGEAPEFVGEDAGIAVPYLDVAAMGTAVRRLGEDPALRRNFGANARKRSRAGFTLETQAPKLLAVIERELTALGRYSSAEPKLGYAEAPQQTP